MRHAKYDQPDSSDFVNKAFNVIIRNPKGEKVYEKNPATDTYAGLTGEWKIPKEASLGFYSFQVGDHKSGSFRVEEYKKPEFEVKVEASKEPIRLGEKIEATIQAKYYFGAPVTRAKVKYKVERSSHSNRWYPDGPGIGSTAPATGGSPPIVPGIQVGASGAAPDLASCTRSTGCPEPPEIVIENEVEIGADGIVKVTIDTAPAKELHGDQDHKYTITAEVVKKGIAAYHRRHRRRAGFPQPFQVFSWVDRGHYRVGDTVKAGFSALTLDRKPVMGKGDLTLFEVSYDKNNKPVEKAKCQTWRAKHGCGGQGSTAA